MQPTHLWLTAAAGQLQPRPVLPVSASSCALATCPLYDTSALPREVCQNAPPFAWRASQVAEFERVALASAGQLQALTTANTGPGSPSAGGGGGGGLAASPNLQQLQSLAPQSGSFKFKPSARTSLLALVRWVALTARQRRRERDRFCSSRASAAAAAAALPASVRIVLATLPRLRRFAGSRPGGRGRRDAQQRRHARHAEPADARDDGQRARGRAAAHAGPRASAGQVRETPLLHLAAGHFALGTAQPLVASPFSYALARSAIRHELMKRVSGRTPEQIAQLVEDELRVQTEHPFEYQDDDEAVFRRWLPHELHGRVAPGGGSGAEVRGVLSARPHTLQVRSSPVARGGVRLAFESRGALAAVRALRVRRTWRWRGSSTACRCSAGSTTRSPRSASTPTRPPRSPTGAPLPSRLHLMRDVRPTAHESR